MKPAKLAVIGVGFWAKFQIPAWREVQGAQLVALCDRDRAKAEAAAQEFGVPKVYGDAEELLRSEPLDFVDLAAGPHAHAPLVELAVRHRTPVICQKPMALDFATCERLVAACRAARVPFLVHENYRWQTPMRRLKQLLNEERIGRPFRAHLQFGHADLCLYKNQPYLFTEPHFALLDMGPHLLDLPRFFFGEPLCLYAREFHIHPQFQGQDIVSVLLGYDRLTCHCELSWRTTQDQVFIEGTTGTLQWGTDGKLTLVNDAGVSVEPLAPQPYPWADPRYGFAHPSIVATNAHLLAALRGEVVAETTAEDNLHTMRLVFAAQDSAARNEVARFHPSINS